MWVAPFPKKGSLNCKSTGGRSEFNTSKYELIQCPLLYKKTRPAFVFLTSLPGGLKHGIVILINPFSLKQLWSRLLSQLQGKKLSQVSSTTFEHNQSHEVGVESPSCAFK